MRWRVEIEGGAPDEGGCETPGHADEEETEGPAEDGGGWVGGRGRGHGAEVGGGRVGGFGGEDVGVPGWERVVGFLLENERMGEVFVVVRW